MAGLLEVKQLSMDFGGLRALDRIDLQVNKAEIVALIGPNGAGKSTFFNCLTGIYVPSSGDIYFSRSLNREKERLNGLKPDKITRKGLARTFQNIRLFSQMTVLENVMIGRHCRTKTGIAGAVLQGRSSRLEEKQIVDDSYDILIKVGLENMVNDLAENLPYGAQRRLEIARALATEPALLLLDEPAAGMNPRETTELNELITMIRDQGAAILLIEHDMKLVMNLSDRIYVMDYGKKIAEGNAAEIRHNKLVIRAYLGEEFDA